MATLQIELPERARDFLISKAAEMGYNSPGEFVAELLHLCRERDSIEKKLIAAVESDDFEEVTPEFWQRLREHAAQGAPPNGTPTA